MKCQAYDSMCMCVHVSMKTNSDRLLIENTDELVCTIDWFGKHCSKVY